MLDPRIPFKNRYLAGLLAFLIPGLGHLYQGRRFKGILCGFCIFSTFFIGQCLGDWSVVYWKKDPTNLLNPYYAQVFVGLPALPALVQARRYDNPENADVMAISSPMQARFSGVLNIQDRSSKLHSGDVEGTISIQPDAEAFGVRGEFAGTLTERDKPPEQVKLQVAGTLTLDKPVSGDPERSTSLQVVEQEGERAQRVGSLVGGVPRRFADWYQAPPDDDFQMAMHRELGKYHELALTFTMLAGLLNILVILDAVEGPAYGYGDAPPAPQASDSRPAKTEPAVATSSVSPGASPAPAAAVKPTVNKS